jgi:hypothetical protein
MYAVVEVMHNEYFYQYNDPSPALRTEVVVLFLQIYNVYTVMKVEHKYFDQLNDPSPAQ